MLRKDYTKLYLLQDKFLEFWSNLKLPFYLTGETALGRYYLNHRYSEDLDFFVNQDKNYDKYITTFAQKLDDFFLIDKKKTLKYDTFSRFYISNNETELKIEFVNDVKYRSEKENDIHFGKIDTPLNILSNKISTIVNRDEPKDIFDIVHIALNYNFNWKTVFFETKEKNIINEINVEQRINSFPLQLFSDVSWAKAKIDTSVYEQYINQIANDFITGSDNSLCKTNINIEDATVKI
ncbi:MAG: nucleotidyl transferase AbiEii/AbiGii toxin family protein [Bacteroidota bacterium]|nr:nucleotidyl transferase AbiEii/AbiGii toxin family protein [Bacteroidota bacterium]